MLYKTPSNVVQLLSEVVAAAQRTAFYRPLLSGRAGITSLDEFRSLPVASLSEFRRQRLGDVVSDPARVQWIAGPHKGQSRYQVAVAEGADETGARYAVFKDALREAFPDSGGRTGAVFTSPGRRYFAAEISTMLGYLRIPAHVFVDDGTGRPYDRLRQVRPELLVILSDHIDESALPSGVELCLTFRRSHRLKGFRQLDIYVIDELGLLGHSTDLRAWILYNDQYFFERSQSGRLIVTSLHSRTQPLLRLETDDEITALGELDAKLGKLSEAG